MNENSFLLLLIIIAIVSMIIKSIDNRISKKKKSCSDDENQDDLSKYRYRKLGFNSESDPNAFSVDKLSREEIDYLKEEAKTRIIDLKNTRNQKLLLDNYSSLTPIDVFQKENESSDSVHRETWNETKFNADIPEFCFDTIDFSHIISGVQFEEYVANNLMCMGYTNVKTTQVTGDFGVDILANKDGNLVAFQCKFYSNPVGVKAIQEIVAGKRYYSAQKGCVITNSEFTKQAKELAEINSIDLYDCKWIEMYFPNKTNYKVKIDYKLTNNEINDYYNHYYKLYESLEKYRIYRAYLLSREYDKKKRSR